MKKSQNRTFCVFGFFRVENKTQVGKVTKNRSFAFVPQKWGPGQI